MIRFGKKNDTMKGLRTSIYTTTELDKAKAWYAEVFETKPYFDETFYVGFDIEGFELGLVPDETPAETKTANVFTYWGVDDIQASYERLLSLGATENEAPEDVGDDVLVATVKDPWGNVLGIIYNPNFKEK